LAPANRLPISDIRKFAAAALIVFGVFLLCCGTGMSNVVVGGAGVLLAIAGPLLILVPSLRGNAKRYVYGTALVQEVSAMPASGTLGRCELELVINARGIDGVPVRVRDAAVPVNKWPDVGATLPVQVVPGNARKVTILWNEVRTHREAAYDDRMYPGYANLSDEERIQEPAPEVQFDHGPLPPDDRQTVTDLPPVDPSGQPDYQVEQLLVMERPAAHSPVSERAATAPARRRPSPRPRRPVRDKRPGGPAAEPAEIVDGSVTSQPSYAIPEAGATAPPDQATPDQATPDETGEVVESPVEASATDPPTAATPEIAPPINAPPADEVETYLPVSHIAETYTPLSDAPSPRSRRRAPREHVEELWRPTVDPADELEPEPLREGGVAQFLAATPRRQPVPLSGVNGVSVTLIVSDLQRSRRFYRDTLGLAELDSSPSSAVLASGDARLVLRRVADMPPVDRRVVHLNLEVTDVYEAYERLRSEGVEFVHRPRVVPQGEQLELCSATFRDPDGHAIALTRWELRR
jgi:catechol 2,3-dioxygenase-like lactoylglutathione lyase family enzyme